MASHRTPLSEEITEEILNLMAGEKDWAIPSKQGEINMRDTQGVLNGLTREFKVEDKC
jgi:hypothetical protein